MNDLSNPAKPNPIRVLHVITRMSVGGAQENTLLSCLGLDKIPEYEVTLLSGLDTMGEGDLLPMARENIRVEIIPELGRSINPISDLPALRKIYRHIKENRYHVIHTHMTKAGVLGRIAAKMAGTPVIVHTQHGLVFHEYQSWPINRTYRLIERVHTPLTDFYLTVSDKIRRTAAEAKIAPADMFRTVRSGMELDWFLNYPGDGKDVRREFGIPENAPVVGKIARLFELKGHAELFEAAPEIVRRNPNVRFFLIGDGRLTDHFKQLADKLGIRENFVFAGMIPRERIPDMIAAMDILVHTSLREGLARVLPQALAMGKPCVSFNLDGAPEVVINDETGYLVEPLDSAGLADAISKLIENPELRKTMGAAGRRLVDPMFRAEKMVADIAEVYQMLLKKKEKQVRAFDARK